jgi:branched-chain amino acid transport system permease protein
MNVFSGAMARVSGIVARAKALPKPAKIALWALFVIFLFLLPILNIPVITTPDSDFGGVLFTVTTYVLVALGLNIVVGYAGLLDLGYVGFYAVGAYTVGVLGSAHAHIPWLLTVPVAVVAALISGIILGAPTLRVRGDYLAIVTLGFGEIVRLTAVNAGWLGAASGITEVPRPPSVSVFSLPHLDWSSGSPIVDLGNTTTFLKFGITDQIPYYWLALMVIFVVIFFDKRIKNSRVGRAWEATREDEDAAELMGVPTFRFKLLAFAMGAFIGGLSGALFAGKQGFISPDSFPLLLSILFIAAVVVGGQGNRGGVILGAIVVAYFPERFREFQEWRVLVFGLALMTLAIFRPQGLIPPRRTVRAKQADQKLEALEEGTASDA